VVFDHAERMARHRGQRDIVVPMRYLAALL
jgi:hypothetical protein